MKIYFAGSIRGGRNDVEIYFQIIEYLRTFGDVLTEHVGNKHLTSGGDDGPNDRFIHDRDLKWLKSADVLIAEVTTVSLGVGYEIGRAVESGKKVLCLYRNEPELNLSAMIAGCPEITVIRYNSVEEIRKIIRNFMKFQDC